MPYNINTPGMGLWATTQNSPFNNLYQQNRPAIDYVDPVTGEHIPVTDPRHPRFQGGGAAGGAAAGASTGNSYDVRNRAALGFLNSVLEGKELPFDQATQANMLTQASDMNAAAEAAQMGQARANAAIGGASMSDPSLQGRSAEFMARRQAQNAAAANAIGRAANTANFGAKMTAAGTLSDLNLAEQDRLMRQQALYRAGAYDSAPQSGQSGHVGQYAGTDWNNNPGGLSQSNQQAMANAYRRRQASAKPDTADQYSYAGLAQKAKSPMSSWSY